MRRRPAALTLVGWTLFVWTTRIFNVWGDADLGTGEKLGRTGLALSFTLLALAAWTVAVWVVRDIRIVAADHDVGFTVVHVVLGVVSIVLAAWAWQEATRTARRPVPV